MTRTIPLNLVSMTPGAMQFTRIPLDPNSCAKTFVSPNKAVLLTEYAPRAFEENHVDKN